MDKRVRIVIPDAANIIFGRPQLCAVQAAEEVEVELPDDPNATPGVGPGAHMPTIGLAPNFVGLASLGLQIGIFCDFLYSVLLLSAVLGLDFLGLTLSRPQVGPSIEQWSAMSDNLGFEVE